MESLLTVYFFTFLFFEFFLLLLVNIYVVSGISIDSSRVGSLRSPIIVMVANTKTVLASTKQKIAPSWLFLLLQNQPMLWEKKRLEQVQWTLANPNSLGQEPIQISEKVGLVKVKAYAMTTITQIYARAFSRDDHYPNKASVRF